MVLGLGTWELMLVGFALLLFFGPEHLPKAMRTLGRMQARVQNTLKDLEDTIEKEQRGPVEYPQLPASESGEIPEDRE